MRGYSERRHLLQLVPVRCNDESFRASRPSRTLGQIRPGRIRDPSLDGVRPRVQRTGRPTCGPFDKPATPDGYARCCMVERHRATISLVIEACDPTPWNEVQARRLSRRNSKIAVQEKPRMPAGFFLVNLSVCSRVYLMKPRSSPLSSHRRPRFPRAGFSLFGNEVRQHERNL